MSEESTQDKLAEGAKVLGQLLELAGLDLAVEVVAEDEGPGRLRVGGDDDWALTGRHEETVTALQHLVTKILTSGELAPAAGPVVESASRPADRDEKLTGLAESLVGLARAAGKSVGVDLLAQADRKALHHGLSTIDGVESMSDGDPAYRRLILRVKGGGGEPQQQK